MVLSERGIGILIFDWDGTLMDSAHLGWQAFQKTFQDLGVEFPDDIYETIYSPNWYAMYEALKLPPEKWKMADELWLQHYGEEEPQFVEGGGETVAGLQELGYRMGIVSSGTCSRVEREIGALGLEKVFEVVVCNEQLVNKKPHPEGLHKAMDAMHSSSEICSYIGDSPEDIRMGRSAGVFTVGVRSAYPTSRNLRAEKPDLYLETISELLQHA